jgi:glycosyltransferase involved in cell wall biosynthesis
MNARIEQLTPPAGSASQAPALKRMALVGPLPPPSGGMANQSLQLARLLREEGIDVTFVQINAPYRPEWAGRIKGLRAVFRMLPYLAQLWRTAGQVQLMHMMANSGWSWHLFAAPAIWIAHLRGTPIVVNYRGGEADNFLRRSAGWVRPSMKRATSLIVPSGFLEYVFGKYGFDPKVVPNIVDLSRFSSAPEDGQRPAPHLLVTRNLEPIYDNATALRVLVKVRARYPDARLTIAGSGELRAELEQLAQELGVAPYVTFTGRVDAANMPALYRSADIMLNPSVIDNTPNSVLEALASGVLVVSTNVGGVPYLVEDGKTALLVPPRDPDAMAQAVLRLLEDRALAARMRAAGTSYVEQYSWASVRPRLLAAYRNALGERQ